MNPLMGSKRIAGGSPPSSVAWPLSKGQVEPTSYIKGHPMELVRFSPVPT